MRTMNYTETRANLAAVLDSVVDDQEEIVVTRSGHEPVVIIPLAQYESMRETDYLMRHPANADFLRRGIAALNRGQGEVHELGAAE
jgi:antitoxin YefM